MIFFPYSILGFSGTALLLFSFCKIAMQRYGGFWRGTNDLHEGRDDLHKHLEETLAGMQLGNRPKCKDRNNVKKLLTPYI